MTHGYWDADGFHEGVMPALNFDSSPRRAPNDDRSQQVGNSWQPLIGLASWKPEISLPERGGDLPESIADMTFTMADAGRPIRAWRP